MNDKINITAKQNMDNLDLIGATILSFAKRGVPIDPLVSLSLSALIAECRVYSTLRDAELDDENSLIIRVEIDRMNKANTAKQEQSVSDAADEIMDELRKSGINI